MLPFNKYISYVICEALCIFEGEFVNQPNLLIISTAFASLNPTTYEFSTNKNLINRIVKRKSCKKWAGQIV